MAIQAVQPNTNQTRNASYLRAGIIGAAGGYIAKHLIPVSKPEFDSFVSQNVVNGTKKLTKLDISNLAKASRSTFDFAVVTAVVLMGAALLKNMYNKLADKSK